MSRSASTAESGPPMQTIGQIEGAEGIRVLSLNPLARTRRALYNFMQLQPRIHKMVRHLRRSAWAGAASLLVFATLVAAASAQSADKPSKDKDTLDPKRPKITLKAN